MATFKALIRKPVGGADSSATLTALTTDGSDPEPDGSGAGNYEAVSVTFTADWDAKTVPALTASIENVDPVVGDTLTLDTNAGPLLRSFQWRIDGGDIIGATSATLDTTATGEGDYTCVVSSGSQSVTTGAVTVEAGSTVTANDQTSSVELYGMKVIAGLASATGADRIVNVRPISGAGRAFWTTDGDIAVMTAQFGASVGTDVVMEVTVGDGTSTATYTLTLDVVAATEAHQIWSPSVQPTGTAVHLHVTTSSGPGDVFWKVTATKPVNKAGMDAATDVLGSTTNRQIVADATGEQLPGSLTGLTPGTTGLWMNFYYVDDTTGESPFYTIPFDLPANNTAVVGYTIPGSASARIDLPNWPTTDPTELTIIQITARKANNGDFIQAVSWNDSADRKTIHRPGNALRFNMTDGTTTSGNMDMPEEYIYESGRSDMRADVITFGRYGATGTDGIRIRRKTRTPVGWSSQSSSNVPNMTGADIGGLTFNILASAADLSVFRHVVFVGAIIDLNDTATLEAIMDNRHVPNPDPHAIEAFMTTWDGVAIPDLQAAGVQKRDLFSLVNAQAGTLQTLAGTVTATVTGAF